MMPNEILEKMKAALRYDPESGLFHWLVDNGPVSAGDQAGCVAPSGYVMIGWDYRNYRAHRLAWLFMTGDWPPKGKEIDHRNRQKSDNRWSNLRLADRVQNGANITVKSDNKSGVRGVYRNQKRGIWEASIRVNYKRIWLGEHATIEAAAEARAKAEKIHYGEFAPTGDRPCSTP